MRRYLSYRFVPVVVLLGLGLLGGFATVLAVDRSLSSVAEADAEVAGGIADAVRSTLTSSMASLAGADVMAVDGTVSAVEFRSFGADVIGASGLAAVAYSEPVLESDRARWEAESGLQIVDIEPGGGRTRAEARFSTTGPTVTPGAFWSVVMRQ